MTAIENIINQIENETRRFGNTKTRVAAVLRLIKAKLVDLFSGKLDKGRYAGTADDLNNAIGNKVDKVPGKILSSNDFTNELRTKLEGLQNVDISGLLPKGGYTGTAQNLKELIDNIMRILQSPDTELDELREIVAFIKQNKRTLDTLGIRNIAGLQDALNGKAPTDHNHDDRYSRLGHTHSEYALRTHTHSEYAPKNHRHNWDEIDGKPDFNYLPTTGGTVNGDITANSIIKKNSSNDKVLLGGGGEKSLSELDNKNIQIGGRNLLLNSKEKVTNSNYNIAIYQLTEEPKEGEIFTVTIKGQLGAGKSVFAIYNSGDGVELSQLYNKGNNIHQNTFIWKKSDNSKTADNKTLWIWTYNSSVTAESTIEWIKLERGNKATDWTPAPEDILEQKTIYVDAPTFYVTNENVNKTVHINRDCTVNYNGMPLLSTICFRKVYDGGQITFHGGGTLKYTSDTVFNGNSGSTAVLDMSADVNRVYIDIRNI